MNFQPDLLQPLPRRRRRWIAGATSALAAAALAGGGVAVALEANAPQAPGAAASQEASAQADQESLASLTSLDGVGEDVAAVDTAVPGTAGAASGAGASGVDLAAVVAPAAAATPSPSAPAAGGSAASSARHPARAALRRALAVVIRQDGTAQYGQHAQAAARAAINRFPASFRRLPEKLRQDLWELAGAATGQETADAQAIKARALDGTYGAAVQKVAQAIQKAPAKAPAPSAPAPSPSPSSGS